LMRNFAIALTTSESDQSLRQRSGNPYLIALRQSSPSFGSKVPTSSEQSNRTKELIHFRQHGGKNYALIL
jgi:hypothetical protein